MRHLEIPVEGGSIHGDLAFPERAQGVVLFAHGSGSGRHSSRNRAVAAALNARGLGTLLVDLLTEAEERIDLETRHLRFDIGLLADRLDFAIRWLLEDPETRALPIGIFGASTGAAAAIAAAIRHPETVRAIVSRGGRPDLAGDALERLAAPTLLIVGSLDAPVIPLNESALERIPAATKQIQIVPGASHLFEEPGKLDLVAELSADWFLRHL
jgi:putative phosphoribosyl transferase